MNRKRLLEISIETLEAALAAERGGAHRIELCGNLSAGGVTPSAELMRAVRLQLGIPVFMMIRPRPGDFVYSSAEFAKMKTEIASAKKLGMNGVVLGILDANHSVDVTRTRELVELARPLPTTFHRAFDETKDLPQALEDVIRTGAARILTSGGAAVASEGAANIAELVAMARRRIVIVAGAGINGSNLAHIAGQTRVQEIHSGLGTTLPYGSRNNDQFEIEVRRLAEILSRL